MGIKTQYRLLLCASLLIVIFSLSNNLAYSQELLLYDHPLAVDSSLMSAEFDTDTGKDNIENHKGKIILLHFWATWCPPCIEEMPHLNDFIKQRAKIHKDGPENYYDIEVSALSQDFQGLKKVIPFLKKNHIDAIKPAHDINGNIFRLSEAQGLPHTILIDHNGAIVARFYGAINWLDPQVIEVIESFQKKAQ